MENLRKENRVVPTEDLLSEMDALEIHGGMSGGQYDPDDTNIYCRAAKCGCNPDSKSTANCVALNLYCGQGTTCNN